MRFPILLLLFVVSVSAADYEIPAERRVTWTKGSYVGVQGGIPTRNNVVTNLTPIGGGVNDATNIQAALERFGTNEAVTVLGDGVYTLTTGINMYFGDDYSHKTLRGSGSNTILKPILADGASAILLGADSDVFVSYLWTNVLEKGVTNLVVTNTANLGVGKIMTIGQISDSNTVWRFFGWSPTGLQEQRVRITAINNSTNIEFWPPTYAKLTNSPYVNCQQFQQSQRCGIENLTFDMTDAGNEASYAISGGSWNNNWVKGVNIWNFDSHGIWVYNTYMSEIRDCWVDGPNAGGSGSGVGIEGFSVNSGLLIENNVVLQSVPGIMISSSTSGSVIGYNYTLFSKAAGVSWMVADINVNHGAHNVMNLVEGNISSKLESDGYHGSLANLTAFRNWFNMTNSEYSQWAQAISMQHFSYGVNIVGNVLGNNLLSPSTPWEPQTTDGSTPMIYRSGYPNTGGGAWTFTNDPSYLNIRYDWLGTNDFTAPATRTWIITGPDSMANLTNSRSFVMTATNYSGAFVFGYVSGRNGNYVTGEVTGASGGSVLTHATNWYAWVWPQNYDWKVIETYLRHMNYDTVTGTNQYIAGESQTLPASLYLPSQPSWWSNGLAYPAIGPDTRPNWPSVSGNTISNYAIIPAQMRYHGLTADAAEIVPGRGKRTGLRGPQRR